jgi:hypothetical protein
MNQQSIFFTCIVAIVAISLMAVAIQFLAKKSNIKMEQDEKISLSYAVWFGSLFIPFMLLLKVALQLVEDSIEIIIYSKTIDNTFWAVMQKISIFIGFSFLATFLAYLIIDKIIKFFIGDRKPYIEMEMNNVAYFTIKGLVLIFLINSLLPVFEHFLRWFLPVIETPFYH